MDFKLEELQAKIENSLPRQFLGNYNPERRREAVLAKIQDYLEEYRHNISSPDPEDAEETGKKYFTKTRLGKWI
jgi:hypothetical protein